VDKEQKDKEQLAARRRALAASSRAGSPFNPDRKVEHCRRFTNNPMEGHMMGNRRVW